VSAWEPSSRQVRSLVTWCDHDSHAPREDRGGRDAQPLERALRHIRIPPDPRRAQNRRAQVGFARGSSTGATKEMLVPIGAVGGTYAGAYLGDAIDDSEDRVRLSA
jgi:hypothetical protein